MTTRTTHPTRLRLGVQGLAPGEAGLVRALLALAGREPRWDFVAEGPCDALVMDAGGDAPRALRERGARAVLLLGEASAHGESLPRPLQPEPFESWLRRAQARLETWTPPATPPRYRLLRWPPAQLLRSEAQRTRMATLLTRRALSTRQLAQLTGADEGSCLRFVQLLQGFSLVLEERDALAPAARPAPAHAPARQGWELVRRIRRSLGL